MVDYVFSWDYELILWGFRIVWRLGFEMFVSFLNSLVGMFSLFFHFHHETLRLLFLLFCGCLFLKSLRSCVLFLIRDFLVCGLHGFCFKLFYEIVLYLVNQRVFWG